MSSPTASNGSASTVSSTAHSQYQDRLISKEIFITPRSNPQAKPDGKRTLTHPSQPTAAKSAHAHRSPQTTRSSLTAVVRSLAPALSCPVLFCSSLNLQNHPPVAFSLTKYLLLPGGRTAWSCTVTVGSQTVHARFWYDGQYVNNAREDAAERALQCFGQLPTPAGPQPAHLQQLQQRHYGAVSS